MLIFEKGTGGPGKKFCDADAMYVLEALSRKHYMGRTQICKMLGLGPASVRSLIAQMESDRLVECSRRGVGISQLGAELLKALPIEPVEIGPNPRFVLGRFTQAVRVPGMGDQVLNGLQQVRTATLMGATGCTTWIVSGGVLKLPPHMVLTTDCGSEFLKTKEGTGMKDGDVLLVCGADTKRDAMVAVMYVALDFY